MISQEEADSMHEKRIQSLREAEEAIDAGMASVEGLSRQEQQLKHSENTLHHQQYLVAKSRRMVRGMSWSGWVANMFTNEPEPPPQISTVPTSSNYKVHLHHQKYQDSSDGTNNVAINSLLVNPETSKENTVSSQLKSQDAYLNEQLKNLEKLGTFGDIISENLTNQNAAIDVISEHTEEVQDETRSVIRMQGRLHRSVRGKPIYLYSIVLEHIDTGRLLSVGQDKHAELLPYQSSQMINNNIKENIPLTAKWKVFQRPDEVCAFRNCATNQYLGQNMMGYIKVRGSDFGNWESFEYNFIRNDTPLLCCSANSNGGGWIHVLPTEKDSTLTNQNMSLKLEAKSDSLIDKKTAAKWHYHIIEGVDVPIVINLKYDQS